MRPPASRERQEHCAGRRRGSISSSRTGRRAVGRLAPGEAELQQHLRMPWQRQRDRITVCCLLYLIAPFSIVRHLMLRRAIDTETLLGAIAAYLLIGMFFAFAYKAAGEFGSVPFFGPAGPGSLSHEPGSALSRSGRYV
jgi:hypothetical protein